MAHRTTNWTVHYAPKLTELQIILNALSASGHTVHTIMAHEVTLGYTVVAYKTAVLYDPRAQAVPVAWLRVEKPVFSNPPRQELTSDPDLAELWRQSEYTLSLTPLYAAPPAVPVAVKPPVPEDA